MPLMPRLPLRFQRLRLSLLRYFAALYYAAIRRYA